LFKAVDQASYGYISELQFIELLHTLWSSHDFVEGMPAAEVKYMVDFVGFKEGKIDYHRLYGPRL
jgi:hypothetical protein